MYTKPLARARALLASTLLGSTLVASGCATLLKGLGADPPAGDPEFGLAEYERHTAGEQSIYVKGATPDWEMRLRSTPSAVRAEYFQRRLFSGGCPGFDIYAHTVGGSDHDLFVPEATDAYDLFEIGAADRRLGGRGVFLPVTDGDFFEITDSHRQSGGRGLFDPVPLGGESPQVFSWQATELYGLAEGGCRSAFLPLFRLGSSERTLVAK